MKFKLFITGYIALWMTVAVISLFLFTQPQQQSQEYSDYYNDENYFQNFFDYNFCPVANDKYELVVETDTYNFYIPYKSSEAIIGKVQMETSCIKDFKKYGVNK